jgi:hypothetical protein
VAVAKSNVDVIVADGERTTNDTGSSVMTVVGTGDTMAGVIAALSVQGLDRRDAAEPGGGSSAGRANSRRSNAGTASSRRTSSGRFSTRCSERRRPRTASARGAAERIEPLGYGPAFEQIRRPRDGSS